MEENRKIVIVSGFSVSILMGCMTLTAIGLNPWENLRSFGIGAILGLGAGVIFSWFFLRNWDPKTLQRNGNQDNHSNAGCWLPVVTIGGVIGGRLLSSYFATDLVDVLVGCLLSAITLFLFVMACLAWRHRPRNTS